MWEIMAAIKGKWSPLERSTSDHPALIGEPSPNPGPIGLTPRLRRIRQRAEAPIGGA
jgi:hypothetical protein